MDNITEKQNPKSKRIGLLSVKEILRIINDEDKTVAKAISSEILKIELLVIDLVKSIKNGGREDVIAVVLGRGANDEKVNEWLKAGSSVDGYKGFAIGRSIF